MAIRADVSMRRTFTPNYHAAQFASSGFFFFFTIVGRAIVMSSKVQMYNHTQKGKYPGKSRSQICGKGAFVDVRLKCY